MKSRLTVIVAFVGLTLGLAFLPQLRAQAKTCYDSSKNVIPCPQSNYQQTQQAKKANGPSATPVPPTDTPSPTPTDTPVPTATDTPKPQQSSALVAPSACPSPAAAVANGPGQTPPTTGSTFFPLLLGGGGLLGGILIGLLLGTFIIGPSMSRGGKGELLPAVNKVNGDGIVGPDRGWNGPITTPGNDKFDKWQKADTGPGGGSHSSQEDAAGVFIKRGDEAGAAVDMFHKGQDLGQAGVNGDGHTAAGSGGGPHIDSNMGDGSV